MDLLHKEITHKDFGEGDIVAQDEAFITVEFNEDTKKFVYPDAFEKFMTLKDPDTAESLDKIISERKAEEEQIEQKEKEARKQQMLEHQRKEKMRNHKIHESSQIVFWLDEEEQQNVFTDWQVFSGEVRSGKNKGEPSLPVRLRPNSVALLTARASDQPETERRILGLYLVHETFLGSASEDGIVPAHAAFRMKLTDQESEKMLFWNYYINKSYPHRTTWNSGKYRYYDNLWTAQILRDILALKTDDEEIKEVKDFLNHFCEINALDINNIPEANGALKQ